MTVIYSNFRDIDTSILPIIWQNIPNVNVVEITTEMIDTYEDIVNNAISNEDDTLILVGHGTGFGLLFPDLNRSIYLIHENNYKLIHARNVICCWCYASSFAVSHPDLHGFFTSMFISNKHEATNEGILVSQDKINDVGKLFYNRINQLLIDNISLDKWVMTIGAKMDIENEVEVFNYQGLYSNI